MATDYDDQNMYSDASLVIVKLEDVEDNFENTADDHENKEVEEGCDVDSFDILKQEGQQLHTNL